MLTGQEQVNATSYQDIIIERFRENPRESNPHLVPGGNGDVNVLDQDSKIGFSNFPGAYTNEPFPVPKDSTSMSSFAPIQSTRVDNPRQYITPPKYTPDIPNKAPSSSTNPTSSVSTLTSVLTPLPIVPSSSVGDYQKKTSDAANSSSQKTKPDDVPVKKSVFDWFIDVTSRNLKPILVGTLVGVSVYCLVRSTSLLVEIRDEIRETSKNTLWTYKHISGDTQTIDW